MDFEILQVSNIKVKYIAYPPLHHILLHRTALHYRGNVLKSGVDLKDAPFFGDPLEEGNYPSIKAAPVTFYLTKNKS